MNSSGKSETGNSVSPSHKAYPSGTVSPLNAMIAPTGTSIVLFSSVSSKRIPRRLVTIAVLWEVATNSGLLISLLPNPPAVSRSVFLITFAKVALVPVGVI